VSVLSVIGVREVTMFELVVVVLCRRLLLLRVQLDLLILCVQLDLLPPVLPACLLRLWSPLRPILHRWLPLLLLWLRLLQFRRVVECVLMALVLLVVDMLVVGARLAVVLVRVVMFVCLGGLRPRLTLAPRGLPPALGSVHFVAVVGVVATLVLMVSPVLELASAMAVGMLLSALMMLVVVARVVVVAVMMVVMMVMVEVVVAMEVLAAMGGVELGMVALRLIICCVLEPLVSRFVRRWMLLRRGGVKMGRRPSLTPTLLPEHFLSRCLSRSLSPAGRLCVWFRLTSLFLPLLFLRTSTMRSSSLTRPAL